MTQWDLAICALISLILVNPAPSRALTVSEAAQLYDIEEGIDDLRRQRDADNHQRRLDRIEQQRRHGQVEHDLWMERCQKYKYCPGVPLSQMRTQAPLTPLAEKYKAVQDYDEFVTRGMTPEQVAQYARQQRADEEEMSRNLEANRTSR